MNNHKVLFLLTVFFLLTGAKCPKGNSSPDVPPPVQPNSFPFQQHGTAQAEEGKKPEQEQEEQGIEADFKKALAALDVDRMLELLVQENGIPMSKMLELFQQTYPDESNIPPELEDFQHRFEALDVPDIYRRELAYTAIHRGQIAAEKQKEVLAQPNGRTNSKFLENCYAGHVQTVAFFQQELAVYLPSYLLGPLNDFRALVEAAKKAINTGKQEALNFINTNQDNALALQAYVHATQQLSEEGKAELLCMGPNLVTNTVGKNNEKVPFLETMLTAKKPNLSLWEFLAYNADTAFLFYRTAVSTAVSDEEYENLKTYTRAKFNKMKGAAEQHPFLNRFFNGAIPQDEEDLY